jgi:hypothetical protein
LANIKVGIENKAERPFSTAWFKRLFKKSRFAFGLCRIDNAIKWLETGWLNLYRRIASHEYCTRAIMWRSKAAVLSITFAQSKSMGNNRKRTRTHERMQVLFLE